MIREGHIIRLAASLPGANLVLRNPAPTQGGGNCPFNAVFGKEMNGEYVCSEVDIRRRMFAENVKIATKESKLYELRCEAIKALIMAKESSELNALNTEIKKYKSFEESDAKRLEILWNHFQLNHLKQHQDIINWIKTKHTLNSNDPSLQMMFSNCLGKDDNLLRGLIFSVPELQRAFETYNKQTQEGYSWDTIVNNPQVIEEYCQWIATPNTWLLPLEVQMMAYAFDVTIPFYNKNTLVIQDTYNPDKPNIEPIHFDGINHYRKMVANDPQSQPPLSSNLNSIDEIIQKINKLLSLNPKDADQLRHRGNYYYKLGNEAKSQKNLLQARKFWELAVAYFKKALSINPRLIPIYKDLGNCLMDLEHHSQALSYLYEMIQIAPDEITPAYYVVRGKAYLKTAHYAEALKDFKYAQQNGYHLDLSELIQKSEANLKKLENQRLSRLQIPLKQRMIKKFKERSVAFSEKIYNTRHATEDPYFILSMDGGGIRGIFHGLFCSAIEQRARLPISSLYNLMSGTSTGGIVALALTAPGSASNTPKFSAYDALNLYLSRGSEIFQKPLVNIPNLTLRYTDKGLEKIAADYFGELRMKEALTDLLVTSYETVTKQPFFFTRYDAKKNPDLNFYMREVLRATSAAPTFLPPKLIKKYKFIDGGVSTNDPTMAAYAWAQQHGIAQNAIHITSFGTGSPKPMPIEDSVLFRGDLYWASTIPGVAMDGANFNVQKNMTDIFSSLPGQYNRFQPTLDQPIRLDSVEEKNIQTLVDIGETFIEMEDASEENRINRTVEKLTQFH